METVRNLQSVGLDVEWDLECLPVCIPKRKWLAMLHEKYPPQMEIISQEEILAGLRELTEGILKYEGDEVYFNFHSDTVMMHINLLITLLFVSMLKLLNMGPIIATTELSLS